MKIKVIDIEDTYVTSEAIPDDRWSRDSTDTHHDIRGIEVVDDNDFYDLDTVFPIKKNKNYYLLYATYSTGDSFGSDGGRIDFIQLYTIKSIADQSAAMLKSAKGHTVTILTNDRKELQYGIPWNGYFEVLESIGVQTVNVVRPRN